MRGLLAALVLVSSVAFAAPGNLLDGKVAIQWDGTRTPEVITDGVAPRESGFWNTNRTATIAKDKGFVIWDLGEVKDIRAGLLQGDDNDEYLIDGSEDRTTWKSLWVAPGITGGGMRTRVSRVLDGKARYVRLTARGGDGSYSVGELELYSTAEGPNESALPRKRGRDPDSPSPMFLWLGAAVVCFLAWSYRKDIPWWLGSPAWGTVL